MDIIKRIEANSTILSKSEMKVANYYINNLEDAVECTLLEISKILNVGEATIVRFSKKIGYDCFKNMQLESSIDLERNKGKNKKQFYHELEKGITDAIGNTILNLDDKNIENIAKEIDKHENCVCIGVGASGFSAHILSIRLIRNGKKTYYIEDNHNETIFLSTIDESFTVIAFSNSGTAVDTVEAAKLAKNKGATIIGITSSLISPLADISDYVLFCNKRAKVISGGNLATQINQIFIADVIATAYSLIDTERSIKVKKETYNSIVSKHFE